MSRVEERIRAGDLGFLDKRSLEEFVLRQRWFGSKSSEVSEVSVLDAPPLRQTPPHLLDALIEIRFQPGTRDIYHVPLGFRSADEGWTDGVIARADGWVAYDALADPLLLRELVGHVRRSSTIGSGEDTLFFRETGALTIPDSPEVLRSVGAEQSNSSYVIDERLVLKLYRRLEAGPNPELELLAFLTDRAFRSVPALAGWVGFEGRVMEATLAIVQEFVPSEGDGWELALAALRSDPESFLPLLHRLGEVTGALHAALASDPSDPVFAPEEPSSEALGLLGATTEEEIEATFRDLPEDPVFEPIAGRSQDLLELVGGLAQAGSFGRSIRTHGDYHLGQVVRARDDWMVIDFEGEPARPLAERRRKRSPLRDVAGMLRSLAYAAAASARAGAPAPPGWEERARREFLGGYSAVAAGTGLLPASEGATERVLAVFELQKAVYELRYELDNRPDWVDIPIAAIAALLDRAAGSA